MKHDEKCRYAERRELEAEIGRLKETVNELSGKLNRSPDLETFERMREALKQIEAIGPICSHDCRLADAQIVAEAALRGEE